MKKLFEKWYAQAGIFIVGLRDWQQGVYEANMYKAYRKGFNEGKKVGRNSPQVNRSN